MMTPNDGFGDAPAVETDDETIAAYSKWLHVVANSFLPPWHDRHDDLVQEGRIAMWRALATHDPAKGSLPSWLTQAAKMRMRDVASGKGQPTGHVANRGSREVEAVVSLDALVEEGGVEVLLGVAAAVEGVEMAYHAGEIAEALQSLSPAQQRYVRARFWYGLDPSSREPGMRAMVDLVPEARKRFLWTGSSKQVGARDRLASRLAHLVEA